MADPDIRWRVAEWFLEDESLTADLIDEAAKLLLDWGLARAEAMAQRLEGLSAEEIGALLVGLRRTLKRISQEASQAAPEAQMEQVKALLAEIAFDPQDPEVED